MPDDVDKLKDWVRFLARDNLRLRAQLDEELKHRYGSRSEKKGQGKGKTGGDQKDPPPKPPSDTATDSPGSQEDPAKKPGHGRRPIPPDLPRDEHLVPLDDERCKRCEGPVHRLERVESYRYDYVPGYIRVRVLVRWRCVCDDSSCDGPFRIAKLPPEPIPKGRATAGFLAHLLVIKFADHCPLYRFRKILLRQKVDLPLSTLVGYCTKSTELLKPLWNLFRSQVLQSEIIRTDDTHVRVRLPRKKGVLKGHLWAYMGDESHPYVVFEFTPNWEGKAPQAFLATFKGYIQADGYKGYDALFNDGTRVEVGCMAHSRRRWVKAQASSPHVAGKALEMIGQLYAIEEECEALTPDQRKAIRQERSAPVLEKLRLWMEDEKTRTLPKSAVGEAIEYAQNQWTALTRFLEDGRLKIDNNEVEREMRAVALGRKNWLAVGSDVGGETAAIGYTMIASAVACGVEPVAWLTDVLERIVTCPADQLVELLPDRWKAARDEQRPSAAGVTVDEDVAEATSPTTPTSPSPPLAHPPDTEAEQQATESAQRSEDSGGPSESQAHRSDPHSDKTSTAVAQKPSPEPILPTHEPSGDPTGSSMSAPAASASTEMILPTGGPAMQPHRSPRPEPRRTAQSRSRDEPPKHNGRPARAPP